MLYELSLALYYQLYVSLCFCLCNDDEHRILCIVLIYLRLVSDKVLSASFFASLWLKDFAVSFKNFPAFSSCNWPCQHSRFNRLWYDMIIYDMLWYNAYMCVFCAVFNGQGQVKNSFSWRNYTSLFRKHAVLSLLYFCSHTTRTIIEFVNAPENQVFTANLTQVVSQLSDNLISSCGGLLPLLAAATSNLVRFI